MGKRIVKQKLSWTGSVLTCEYPTIRKSVSVDVSGLADEVRTAAMFHGFTQKYGDAASGGEPQEKFEMVQRIKAAHEAGSWDVTDRAAVDPVRVYEAIAHLKDCEVSEVEALVKKLPDPEAFIKKARADAQIKATMLELAAERAKAAAATADADEGVFEALGL